VSTDLDSRYGRTRQSTTRTRIIGWSAAGAFAVVFAAWLVWAGVLAPAAQLDTRDLGHQIVDDTLVDVSFEVTVEPGTAVSCAIQAMNSSFSVVGWKIIELPSSQTRTRVLSDSVRTTELATTGLIYRCWLT
jgi:hypothetical protein